MNILCREKSEFPPFVSGTVQPVVAAVVVRAQNVAPASVGGYSGGFVEPLIGNLLVAAPGGVKIEID